MFVSGEPVAVKVGENTIFIKPKMDFGTKQRVLGAMTRGSGVDMGEYYVALMAQNIVKWEGPAFKGIQCTPENIARLDPDEPLVEAVLDAIVEANRPKRPLAGESATSAGAQP